MRRILAALASAVMLAACDGPPAENHAADSTSASTTPETAQATGTSTESTAITPLPGAHRSSIANVYVLPIATLDPEDVGADSENWALRGISYPDAVAQERALLPIGQPLEGLPWCQEANMSLTQSEEQNWIWGFPQRAVIVSIIPVADEQMLVVRRSTNASLYC